MRRKILFVLSKDLVKRLSINHCRSPLGKSQRLLGHTQNARPDCIIDLPPVKLRFYTDSILLIGACAFNFLYISANRKGSLSRAAFLWLYVKCTLYKSDKDSIHPIRLENIPTLYNPKKYKTDWLRHTPCNVPSPLFLPGRMYIQAVLLETHKQY